MAWGLHRSMRPYGMGSGGCRSRSRRMVARPSGALAGYDPAGYFCELQHCVAQSAHGQLIRSRLDALGLERARPSRPGGRGRAVQSGHHLHDLQRRRRDRPHPAVRRDPAHHHRRGLGRDRGRRAPARADAQPVPGRHLRPAEGAQGRADPAGAGAGQRQLPRRDAGPGAAARHLHPHQRHRPRPRRRRAGSACSRTMAARRRACPTWSRTAT